ncbi:MAC/perforin domain-containing protein [Sphingobacterium hungaricum]|uniref:MAC/Perforin domain-containing protein n=1 Tax=Sphingobacterium hungaricum TaxID=2082723 RepID=A0A928YR29_9SPHI|nr:MAC/perforin domain-containing protein [Sphingobacterium hungaricum]MBE8714881.1 hypothetical protein [Sphingobacterium hungaricum]
MSCSDTIELPVETEENIYKTGIDLSTSKTIAVEKKWGSEELFMLGYGYDATGKYAHPAYIKGKIMNASKFYNENKSLITISKTNSRGTELPTGGTKEQVLATISEKAGFTSDELLRYTNLFKAHFENKFENDKTFENLSYKFYGISELWASTLMRINYPQGRDEWFLTNYLTDEFKNDLSTKSADDIIKLYGTHLLTNITIGSRIDYLYRYAEDRKSNSDYWFIYNIPYYFNPAAHVYTVKPEEAAPLKENMYVEVIDGLNPSPNIWMIDITNYKKERINYKGFDSLTEENVTLVDFHNQGNKLIPIYDLALDPAKKEALIIAYNKFLGATQ